MVRSCGVQRCGVPICRGKPFFLQPLWLASFYNISINSRNQASYWRLYKGGQLISLGVGFFSASYTKDLKTQNLKLSLVAPSFPPPLLKIYFNLGYIFSRKGGTILTHSGVDQWLWCGLAFVKCPVVDSRVFVKDLVSIILQGGKILITSFLSADWQPFAIYHLGSWVSGQQQWVL